MSSDPLIHALIISDSDGRFLVDVIRNKKLDTARLSGFIGALKMFGEETLGNIKDISINGANIDMLVISKDNLIMIAVMNSDLPAINFREGCERALTLFKTLHGDEINSWNGSLETFRDFQQLLNQQIERYFKELEEYKFKRQTQDKSFEDLREDMVKYNKKFFVQKSKSSIIPFFDDEKDKEIVSKEKPIHEKIKEEIEGKIEKKPEKKEIAKRLNKISEEQIKKDLEKELKQTLAKIKKD